MGLAPRFAPLPRLLLAVPAVHLLADLRDPPLRQPILGRHLGLRPPIHLHLVGNLPIPRAGRLAIPRRRDDPLKNCCVVSFVVVLVVMGGSLCTGRWLWSLAGTKLVPVSGKDFLNSPGAGLLQLVVCAS